MTSGGGNWQELFDFLDEEGQIRLGKTQAGGRNPIVLDVRRHMLVMRMRRSQGRIVRMRLRIIPIEFGGTLPTFIAVADDDSWACVKGGIFDEAQAKPGRKMNFTFDDDNGSATANYHQRRG